MIVMAGCNACNRLSVNAGHVYCSCYKVRVSPEQFLDVACDRIRKDGFVRVKIP